MSTYSKGFLPYTYHLYHRPTGKHYYGVSYACGTKVANPAQLWVSYFTSSKSVKSLVKQYGKESFDVEVRRTFKTAEAAIAWEHRAMRRLGIPNNPKWLNLNLGGSKFTAPSDAVKASRSQRLSGRKLSDETKARMSAAKKGKRLSEEHKAKIGVSGTGRKFTELTRSRMSAAKRRGNTQSPSGL